ncbi:MAG: PEP-CTERM sorting domain-containing protein [Candidatus Eisenbacteria bacterium]|uniref:PEP-CTERM sorting domain-containing protein n=1 Tax=Eiseniibacteriota bacterium TaxID=2212470 RepID=A0A7Y2EDF3_UNCEI|nr:PEP-CTERM sorting domain-containing protein [Candidatus Eisenbacteria bacterium]
MKAKLLILTMVIAMVAAVPAMATTLQIQFSGLNLTYDGNNIAAVNDDLATMNFFDCGILVGTLNSNIAIDMLIPNVGTIFDGNGVYSSGTGFGLDLMTGVGSGINLDWDSPVTVNVNDGGQVSVLGSASTSTINSQNLPFGFNFDTPVQVSFSTQITSSSLTNFAGTRNYYNRFESFGTGEVSGPRSAIPEPATLLTIGVGLLGGAIARRRKK